MLETWKLHLNFYFLCFSFHFLFFFSFYVVSAFMRALVLFDPLMGEVPQITPPCCLSLISASRSPGSHDPLEAVRGMSSSVLCIFQRWGRTRDYVGKNIALTTLLPFLRLLERSLWEWHTLNDLLAVLARKTFFLWSACASIITRYSSQYPEQVPYFSISVNFSATSGKLKPVTTPGWAPPCLMLQPAGLLVFSLLRLKPQHWARGACIVTVLLHEGSIQEIFSCVFPMFLCWISFFF